MPTKKCYKKTSKGYKPNCSDSFCNVSSGECISKIKSGAPRKTKLVTELGSKYHYDKEYGLVGNKKDVEKYIKHINKKKEKTEQETSIRSYIHSYLS